MEPMKPVEPMKPMKPISFGDPWWPSDLGEPSSAGSQDGLRYAFFAKARRLLIEQDGKRTTYDSGDHQINGVSQQDTQALAFSSQNGRVGLDDLKVVS